MQKACEFSSLLFTVTSTNGFYYPPPPLLSKSGLKLVCNVKNVYTETSSLRTLKIRSCPETSRKLYVHEFGFFTHRSKILFVRGILWYSVSYDLGNNGISHHIFLLYSLGYPHRVHIFLYRWNRVSVSAHSAGAYTATLQVMVNVMRGGGRASPHPHQPGLIYPHDWTYARKQRLPLCVLCGYPYCLRPRPRCLELNQRTGIYYII